MSARVAVVGNSDLNIGFAVAADLALAGHQVRLAHWPEFATALEPIRKRGGIAVEGDAAELISATTGVAQLHAITTDIPEAVVGADIVFIDVPVAELEWRFRSLVPHLDDGQIVHQ